MNPIDWWPPAVGDKLRHVTLHGGGDYGVKNVDALLHVLAVFDHVGEVRIVTAEWFPTRKRWNYEVFNERQANFGTIFRDGDPNPYTPKDIK